MQWGSPGSVSEPKGERQVLLTLPVPLRPLPLLCPGHTPAPAPITVPAPGIHLFWVPWLWPSVTQPRTLQGSSFHENQTWVWPCTHILFVNTVAHLPLNI